MVTKAFLLEKVETVDFSETIAASDNNLQNSFSPEQPANFYETWYVALGTPTHHSLLE